MKRINVPMTDDQYERVQRRADEGTMTLSEVVRDVLFRGGASLGGKGVLTRAEVAEEAPSRVQQVTSLTCPVCDEVFPRFYGVKPNLYDHMLTKHGEVEAHEHLTNLHAANARVPVPPPIRRKTKKG